MVNDRSINPLMKSTFVYLISTVIGQGMSFLGIIIFTRIMNQADYGNYSTYYAYVSIFTVLAGANLYYALNNAYIDKANTIKAFRKTVLVLSALTASGFLLIALILGTFVTGRFSAFVIVMGVLHSYGFFVVNFRIYSANMENDFKRKGLLLILPNMLQFLFALILILLLPGFGFAARVVGSTAGMAVIAAGIFLEILRADGRFINTEDWKYALSISIPSVVMSLSYMLMQQCDKVMITAMCGADETAVYSVIYYLGYAIIAVDQAAAPVRQAWLFKRLDTGDITGLKTVQKWYLLVMATLATAVLMIGPEAVKILAPVYYWKYEYIAPFVLSACMMILYRFYTEILLFYKRNISLSASVLVCALLNVGLNYLLIPRYGAVAACYTTVVSYFLLFILTWLLTKRYYGNLYSMGYFSAFILCLLPVAAIFFAAVEKPLMRYAAFAVLAVGMLMYLITNNDWKQLVLGNAKHQR